MLRKITVNLNILTAMSVFWIVLFQSDWLSDHFWTGGWVLVLALITTLITGVYLKVTRFEREAYHEKSRH